MAKLGEYRRKRRPDATNEPFGDEPPGVAQGAAEAEAPAPTLAGAFVVQLHDATRRHYDVRLEIGGALASFAVPRGPSLDPDEKLLAVKTEDHPLEYLEFEDVIPEGQYGAGPMIVWDRGRVEYLEGPAEEEVSRGKLHVRLRGHKLRGAFAFVKLAKGETGNEWLMFKKADEHASKERAIVTELPCSVLSGLTVEELGHKAEIGEAIVRRAFELGAARLTAPVAAALAQPERSPLVRAAPAEKLGRGEWIFDADLDGVRVVASREDDTISIRTFDASGAPTLIEAFYPEVVRALRALPVTRLVVEGKLVAFDASGHPRLSLLAQRIATIAKGDAHRATTETPVALVTEDMLVLGDADLRALPLSSRRELLSRALPALGFVRAAPPLEGALEPLISFCREHEIGALVAKPKSSPYDPKHAGWLLVSTGAARGHDGASERTTVDHSAADSARALRKVVVTNRAKVFWPAEQGGFTKGDLCDYYAAIAGSILPYLRERPVILVRYPDGIDGKSFFQWNVPPGMPAWVRTLPFEDEGHTRRGFLVDDASTLLYLANLACIPLHILAARAPHLDEADFFTMDFDVKQSELRHAITLAKALREMLDAIGLRGLPKTSGQTGMHVLVPLGPGQSFDTARGLADLLGRLLVERFGDIATMERTVNKRGAKVYVDTGQTGPSRAIVAPYSVRAAPGATVSTPLTWDEVDDALDPRAFTIETVPGRVARHGDPMASLLSERPDVPRAVTRLAELVAQRPG
jgi:bifunctional non-homologous end joining protein LigD